ncbi:hypothetical protein BS329_26920 [Amycolatopsis coloradensis]|uniref:Uncharacterized protein n=1 Tax=Amycolatopsis coloradensis TaxID=76021 RepID=A0A1R0KLL4_9PSEU|nr:hypothetical protein [Amycolatopsis coloradensis]OLZ47543.1 hypothetical protein BS329_26920 [Amycolatopsis coloradensis]
MKSPGKRTLLAGGAVLAVVLMSTLTANAVPAPAPAIVQTAQAGTPWGDVIGTGVHGDGGELVFSGVKIDVEQLPGTTFGIMAGRRPAGGQVTAGVVANEFEGSDKAPGFHAVSGGINGYPSFGYYAGPAVKITAKVAGKSVTARQAPWSVDPNVVVFWFDSDADPLELAAFDASGKELPAGNTGVGHG